MGTGEFNAGGNPAMDYHPIQEGLEILPIASCYRNRDKLQPDGPLGPNADFFCHTLMNDRLSSSDSLFRMHRILSRKLDKEIAQKCRAWCRNIHTNECWGCEA